MHCRHIIAISQNKSSEIMLIRIEMLASFIAVKTSGGSQDSIWPENKYMPINSASWPSGIIVTAMNLSVVYFQPPQVPQNAANR
mmetsp:Transcript_34726/g.73212  ORF Transcript_34726/g.73212 Transcript_34726/m.73212 type:complete len:84 (-) Transcript_34726:439-690(-)